MVYGLPPIKVCTARETYNQLVIGFHIDIFILIERRSKIAHSPPIELLNVRETYRQLVIGFDSRLKYPFPFSEW